MAWVIIDQKITKIRIYPIFVCGHRCSERKSQIINIPKFIIMWERIEIIEASIKFKK